ncbi:MAG: hypothetical protein AB7L41_02085 [Flavobacteriaceae bacterium]
MARYVKLAERKPVAEKGLLRRLSNRMDVALQPAKRLRNTVSTAYHCAKGSPDLAALLASPEHRAADCVTFTVAFNDARTIALLIEAWRLHVTDSLLVVADNSTDAAARREIAGICGKAGIFHLRLPANRLANYSRNHGLALNWIWRRAVMGLKPRIAGLLDHDCYPSKPFSAATYVGDLVVAGRMRSDDYHGPKRYPWPGFSFFRTGAPEIGKLDFDTDRLNFLDTGGGNWRRLMRGLDPAKYHAATLKGVELAVEDGPPLRVEMLDDRFIHLGGLAWTDRFHDEAWRRGVEAALRKRVGLPDQPAI